MSRSVDIFRNTHLQGWDMKSSRGHDYFKPLLLLAQEMRKLSCDFKKGLYDQESCDLKCQHIRSSCWRQVSNIYNPIIMISDPIDLSSQAIRTRLPASLKSECKFLTKFPVFDETGVIKNINGHYLLIGVFASRSYLIASWL